jgi:hypothetical protein
VLLAPLCLFLFGKVMKVSSALGFIMMSFIIFTTFLVMFRHLAVHLLNFLAKRFHNIVYDLHFKGYPFGPNYAEEKIAILVRGNSIRNIAFLLGESSKLHLIFVKEKKGFFDPIFKFFNHIDVVSLEDNLEDKFRKLPQSVRPAIFFLDSSHYTSFEQKGLFRIMKSELGFELKRFHVKHISRFKPKWFQLKGRMKVHVQFDSLKLESIENLRQTVELAALNPL